MTCGLNFKDANISSADVESSKTIAANVFSAVI